jgi:hypothetical protein
MTRSDKLDLILDGPRVQVPVECLNREAGLSRPVPPVFAETIQSEFTVTEADELDELALLICESRFEQPPAGIEEPENATWVCPAHWLLPSMRAEGSSVWLDPTPVHPVVPVLFWLPAKAETGGRGRF